jgi:Mg-chelatase subunit ChlD
MILDPNDPRLIDLALGELDPQEAQELNAALQAPENAEARNAVREFQQLAGLAKTTLAEEPATPLEPGQREAVLDAAEDAGRSNVTAFPRKRSFLPWISLAAASAAVVLIGFGVTLLNSNQNLVSDETMAYETFLQNAQKNALPGDAPAVPAEVREQMDALGYLQDDGAAQSSATAAETPEVKTEADTTATSVPESEVPAPVETTPVETAPVETAPVETAPVPPLPAATPEPEAEPVSPPSPTTPEPAAASEAKEDTPAEVPVAQAVSSVAGDESAQRESIRIASTPQPNMESSGPQAKQVQDTANMTDSTAEALEAMGYLGGAPAASAPAASAPAPEAAPNAEATVPVEAPPAASPLVELWAENAAKHPETARSEPAAPASPPVAKSGRAPKRETAKRTKVVADSPPPPIMADAATPMPAPPMASEPPPPPAPVSMSVAADSFESIQWDAAPAPPPVQSWHYTGGESYRPITENVFEQVVQKPLSTFSIDVDTGSYANVRRFLNQGQRPPVDAVRLEELINYFDYTLPQPEGPEPFSVTMEMADCPWAPGHKLARVALQGKTVTAEERGAGNFVFLVDVSGSMGEPNKLPLVRESMKALLEQLEARDRVAIVTYASNAGVALPSTSCSEKDAIRAAIDGLSAGGSTNGAGGIQAAYDIARAHFVPGGVNRVLLATDGDFNVGVTSHDALMQLITEQAKSRVFLTALGYGMGNYKDGTLEQLADKGNGNYAYIDSFAEARKVLVEQINGTLVTIAKDVKIQVEFNPQHVQAYRLLGYENRALAARDFNDDTKDAGEIGAGHQCTALYQIVPAGMPVEAGVDALKYGPAPAPVAESDAPRSPEWMTVKLRYKHPEGDTSAKIEVPWANPGGDLLQASPDFRFAASVAAFGMILRNSEHKGRARFDGVQLLAQSGKGTDPERQAFIDLVVTAKTLSIE